MGGGGDNCLIHFILDEHVTSLTVRINGNEEGMTYTDKDFSIEVKKGDNIIWSATFETNYENYTFPSWRNNIQESETIYIISVRSQFVLNGAYYKELLDVYSVNDIDLLQESSNLDIYRRVETISDNLILGQTLNIKMKLKPEFKSYFFIEYRHGSPVDMTRKEVDITVTVNDEHFSRSLSDDVIKHIYWFPIPVYIDNHSYEYPSYINLSGLELYLQQGRNLNQPRPTEATELMLNMNTDFTGSNLRQYFAHNGSDNTATYTHIVLLDIKDYTNTYPVHNVSPYANVFATWLIDYNNNIKIFAGQDYFSDYFYYPTNYNTAPIIIKKIN